MEFPLREFLTQLVGGIGWRELGVVAPPDISDFPIPGFTVVVFLAVLWLTLQRRRLTVIRLTLLTVLWALQSQIHPVNAAVGLIAWFAYFPLELVRQHRWRPTLLFRQFALQGVVALLVCMPAVVGWSGELLRGVEFIRDPWPAPSGMFGGYFFFAYLLLPLALTALLYSIVRIDVFELITRFRLIYTLMAVEFALVGLNLLTGAGIPAENIHTRLGVYVLHPLYYLPVVSMLSRTHLGQTGQAYTEGVESSWFAVRLRAALDWLTNDASKVFLPLLLMILTLYAGTSAMQSYVFVTEVNQKRASDVTKVTEVLTDGLGPEFTVATDILQANLFVPVLTQQGSLWVSRFSNRLGTDEIIARLALYAKLKGWSQSEFDAFMSPVALKATTNLFAKDTEIPAGLGYWYAMHMKRHANDSDAKRFSAMVSSALKDVDLARDIQRFRLKRWLSSVPLPEGLIPAAAIIDLCGPNLSFRWT